MEQHVFEDLAPMLVTTETVAQSVATFLQNFKFRPSQEVSICIICNSFGFMLFIHLAHTRLTYTVSLMSVKSSRYEFT